MHFFMILVIGVLVEQVSTSTIYYVDVKRGAKENDGMSLKKPFLTIQACVDTLKEPGDECRIRLVKQNNLNRHCPLSLILFYFKHFSF